MKEQTKKKLKLAATLMVAALAIILTVKLMPWFAALVRDPAAREELKDYVSSLGWRGVLFMLGIQVLQVVVAVLPGEPVELVAGMIYGAWGGLLLCLTGLLIGSSIVFFSVKALGRGFVERRMNKEHKGLLSFLDDSKKLEVITFLLFFIPGTPKDTVTYVAPLTRISPRIFLTIATLARIPSVITSTYAGQMFIDGELWKTVAMFVLMGIIGIAGILVNNSLFANRKKNKKAAGGASNNEKRH